MSVFDVAWLAGLWEGDGSICAYWAYQNDRKHKVMHTVVALGVTDLRLAKKTATILNEITGRKPKIYQQLRKGYRPFYRVALSRRASVRKFLEILQPFLVSKYRQAQLVLQIVAWSMDNVPRGGERKEWPPWVNAAVDQIRADNLTRIPIEEQVSTHLSTIPSEAGPCQTGTCTD
jgi:hypothetical protein